MSSDDGGDVPVDVQSPTRQSKITDLKLPSPGGQAAVDDSADSDDGRYDRLRRTVTATIKITDAHSAREELKRFKQLEELSWLAGTRQQQNLFWLLRAKHAEALVRAHDDSSDAISIRRLAGMAAIAGVGVAFVGWLLLIGVSVINLYHGSKPLPDHMWQMILATSGTVLLIVGTATLLFRVAAQSHHRILCHSAEADSTRRIEVAVRLILSSDLASDDKGRTELAKLGMQMLNPTSKIEEPKDADLSAVPDIVKELLSAALKAKDLK